MATAYNWQWGRDIEIDDRFFNRMKRHGFYPWHTGGGCMAWCKDLDDDDGYVLITYDGDELGAEPGQIEERQWGVGRYNNEHSGWCFVLRGPLGELTLAECLRAATRIPAPAENDAKFLVYRRAGEYREIKL